MANVLKTTIQIRRATEAEWLENKEVVLAAGEPAMILDGEHKGQVKWGDGTTTWENLPYSSGDLSELDASNVYYTQDFVFTRPFGKYVPDETGKVTVPATGKNNVELFNDAYSEDINPQITQPSASISASAMKSYEAGTTVTPSYTASLNPGSYEFGPATGITATAWEVTFNEESKDTNSGSFSPIQVTDAMNLQIVAKATHGDGAMPLTALEKEYADGQIKAGTKTATSGALKGYRRYFYGVDKTSGEINSALIRGLTGSAGAAAATTLTVNSSAGAIRSIVALPTASGLKVKQVLLTSSMNADITGNYVKNPDPIQVEGAEGYTAVDYDVYVYQPASYDAAEVHKITIGK